MSAAAGMGAREQSSSLPVAGVGLCGCAQTLLGLAGVAAVVVGQDRRVLSATEDARTLLERGKLLHAENGKLHLGAQGNGYSLAQDAEFGGWLQQVMARRAPGCLSFAIERGGLRLQVVATALDDAAVVFLGRAEDDHSNAVQLVAAMYKLSPSESRFLAEFLACCDVAAAAHAVSITESTGRSMLKNLFRKTGTKKQAELVRLFIGLPQGVPTGTGGLKRSVGAATLLSG